MSRFEVFISAVGPEPLATPADIAADRLMAHDQVMACSSRRWRGEVLEFTATVEAEDLRSATAIVQQVLASGSYSVYSQFRVTGEPLSRQPMIGGI